MRDRIDIAAIDEAEARGRKARGHGIAIGAIGIEVERRAAVPGEALFINEADGNHRPVACLDRYALGCILRRIVARGDFLHLERGKAARRDVVIIDGVGGRHRFVRQA